LKKSFVHDFGISEEKVITVYAGTNLKVEDFDKNYDSKTILFVGKNFERKGGEALLEAFRLVRKKIKDAKLIIIGPNLNINKEGVEVKGLITDKNELAKYFKQASIFVLPSLFEPFGIVFAEAFAYKNPCIGSNICAMPEIIEEGKGGFLISPNDYKILADRIITLLEDENLSKKMGSYGFEKVKNIFNWDIVVNKMLFHCSKIV
jgi:glycosyltransferase involved in cell wall biosynthesis